jgi:transposase
LEKLTERGFGTAPWTLKRICVVIKRLYGVKYSEAQIWRILGALGFSPHKRTLHRNEGVV